MKSFNHELNQDIEKLKILHAKKDKTDFNRLKSELMLKHSVSKATVYREMKKETPGFYKKPDYNPPHRPVTEKEIQMVAELLLKGRDVQDIIRLMQQKTGDKYTWDRITQIRKIIDLRLDKKVDNEVNNETQNPAEPPEVSGEITDETAFGDKFRDFIESLFELDNIHSGCKLTVSAGGEKFELSYTDIKDITLIVTNSKARGGQAPLEYMRRKIFHLIASKLRRAASSGEHAVSLKDISELNRMYSEFEARELEGFSPDYRVLVAVVTHLMPGADYSELLSLAMRYHDEITGSTRNIVPYKTWLLRQSDFAEYTELFNGLKYAIEEGEAVITGPDKVFPWIKGHTTELMSAYVKLYEMYLGKERVEHNMKVGAFRTLQEEAEISIRAKQPQENQSKFNIMGEPRMSLNPDEWEGLKAIRN